MTEEEYFIKNYPDFCYYDKPLSPYWDLFQNGVEFGERQSEKKVEKLEENNRELKKEVLEVRQHLELTEREWGKDTVKLIHFKTQLTKAKEILQVVLDKWKKDRWILYSDEKIKQIENLMKQTEQFIKEI